MTNPQTEARRLWKEHGGGQHGPHVETLTMPLDNFSGFVDALTATALEAKLEAVKGERDAYKTEYEDACVDGMKQAARAEAAEAQLAEANKALEEIADAKTELTDRHDYSRGWNDALFRVRQIARRAIASGEK